MLGSSDWTKEGVTMTREDSEDSNVPSKADFHSGFDVVFVDPSGYLNLCAGMTVAQYRRLQHEARLSLEFLDRSFMDSFEVLFMKPVPFIQTFDQFLQIPNISALEVICRRNDLLSHLIDHPGDWTPVVTDWLLHLVMRGLGKRVEMLCFKPQTPFQIVNRLSVLARESHLILERQIETGALQPTNFKQIFRPPLDHYDVIIHLHSRLVPHRTQALDKRKHPTEQASFSHPSVLLPVVNFDPAQLYLEELKDAFPDIALFFHDVNGGDLIGTVWKPQRFVLVPFKVLHAPYKMPLSNPQTTEKSKQGQSLVIPNISAILSDFQTIGEGLVNKIEVLNA